MPIPTSQNRRTHTKRKGEREREEQGRAGERNSRGIKRERNKAREGRVPFPQVHEREGAEEHATRGERRQREVEGGSRGCSRGQKH